MPRKMPEAAAQGLYRGSGLLVVDKPGGWTSHQVVGRARRLLGTRKVGHAGTLDPMATGLLILGVNRATRLLGHLALHDKRYLATVRLGQATSTDDAEGEITAAAGAGGVPDGAVAAAAAAFVGRSQQVPSSVSAIKVAGQRAYARVRRGEEVVLAAREVEISRLDVLDVRRPSGSEGVRVVDVDIDVECSSGTYVRAIARDLGNRLGTGGHLTALRRTRVGVFTLADVTLGDRELSGEPAGEVDLLGLREVARRAFSFVEVDEASAADVRNGRPLALDVPDDPTALVGPGGEFLALYRPAGSGRSRPVAVLC